jgi:hypothetical protein
MTDKEYQRYLEDKEMGYMCGADSDGLILGTIGLFLSVVFYVMVVVIK